MNNEELQINLEQSVLEYQCALKENSKFKMEDAYKKITRYYNPMSYYSFWYDQYKHLFDSQDDFISDYIRVFITVITNWRPKDQRNKSRYNGSGEFKNYFIGSLYHNYVNMIKSDQAAKRNVTQQCPICNDWVNPMSTHIITDHSNLLWEYLEELNINIENAIHCPCCDSFKISKQNMSRSRELMKAHFISKHTKLLFAKFNEMFPHISTVSPKITSNQIVDENDELDIYEVTEAKSNLFDKLLYLGLTQNQKIMIEGVLNGETNIVYKSDRYDCSKEQWEKELESLKEVVSIHGII